ncbi:tetratricopeptide (TPR) repeat protein [Pedobacter cryoconitis]|uniref:RagB/SusD family nutrient uptake outer membrane protein n=1 Tax=Pedobacter cryoconitis TaxID=188932 RepID=UPI00160E9EA8|nr:RagB/SusD family nutrient uptake outer membrane protein [Pedobacter cryoconitis]MBB6270848.1 tetratricopeptide (TPR) repeat protein [Pedobacter cryoconitis]
MKNKLYKSLFLILFIVNLMACKKGFLDEKPDKALLVPETLQDVKQLLDNSSQVFNISTGLDLVSADEYITDQATLSTLEAYERNSYLWEKDIYPGVINVSDWFIPYQQVFYANIALETLEKINPSEKDKKEWRRLKGIAFFYRGFAFYNLVKLFAAQYDKQSADQLPGIPLRLKSTINVPSVRANLQESYNQIINDITTANGLLLLNEEVKTRPDKKAAFALLARVFLSMQDYTNAGNYADSCLKLQSNLIDYNTISSAGTGRPFPSAFPTGNMEILFFSGIISYDFPAFNADIIIDPVLYESYDVNDLRKLLFFRERSEKGRMTFRGTYSGNNKNALFAGLATDEMYLIRAECLARQNRIEEAMFLFNKLLVTRWKTDTYIDKVAVSTAEALHFILEERKKELLARGLRWNDLKRLNKDPTYATELQRNINGKLYVLKPNDLRYVFPIPDTEIGHGLIQNPR